MVKSTCSPCRVPGFSSQHPYGCSQPPVTLIPEQQMPSSGLYGLLHTYGTHKLMGAHTHTHKYNFKCVLLVYNHLKIFVKVHFLCQILGFGFFFKDSFLLFYIFACVGVYMSVGAQCGQRLQISRSWNYIWLSSHEMCVLRAKLRSAEQAVHVRHHLAIPSTCFWWHM